MEGREMTRRETRWLARMAPHPVAGWVDNQVTYINTGALEDFPALFKGMTSRRRARVVTGLFRESVATIDISNLENA
jgi:hypothetical protein